MVSSIVTANAATTYTKWRSNMKKVAIIGSGNIPTLTYAIEHTLIACGEEMNKKLDEFNTPFIPFTITEQRRYLQVLSGQEKRRIRRKQNRSK